MRIYFLGVAGTAMGNAALLLRDLGHEIIGSDQAVYPPMSDMLLDAGVEILEGYRADRLSDLKPDLVVVGNAFSRGNEEVEYLLESRALEFVSLPEALKRFVLSTRRNIVVTGTHGKTTTSALTAFLLQQANVDPGFMIGGAPLDPEKGWANGDPNAPFVIEGDEYDSAFFDKRSKFIHYAPHIVILNNLEFDHADIFRDLQDVKRTFEHLTRIVPKNGFLLVNGDDENALSLLPISWTKVYQVGLAEECDLRIENYRTTSHGSSFDLVWQGRQWISVKWPMTGLFNARNAAMACLAAALSISETGSPLSFEAKGIASFRGVKRRQQILSESEQRIVIEDFAHHPTAIREILRALKNRYENWTLVAAFEPRSNTSRLDVMREPMLDALSIADAVVIGAAKHRSNENVEVMDTESLASQLRDRGTSAVASDSNEEALHSLNDLCSKLQYRQVVVFLTNGSFGGIIERFAEASGAD